MYAVCKQANESSSSTSDGTPCSKAYRVIQTLSSLSVLSVEGALLCSALLFCLYVCM